MAGYPCENTCGSISVHRDHDDLFQEDLFYGRILSKGFKQEADASRHHGSLATGRTETPQKSRQYCTEGQYDERR